MRIKVKTLIAIASMIVTAAAIWIGNRSVSPKQASWDDVLAEAKAGGYRVITTGELSERYRQEADRLLLVDTRQDWEFRTGHLKGAVNFPMEPTTWSRWRKASALEEFLGRDRERPVIFY